MNILLIGGVGSLINQIIKKAKKEGHRVHLLTGSRYADSNYEKVFERYNLTYDSECLTDVFESVNPDVTLFMGAFDTNFHWANEQRETVRFTSGLTNILMSYTIADKGRFIYLTSDEVYSGNYDYDIPEDEVTSPSALKGIALAQGEDICQSFIRMRGYDIVTLRLDHFYRSPFVPKEVEDDCAKMCLAALRDKNISASPDEYLSLLYESDAVEFIYQLFRCEKHMHSVYNLSTSAAVSKYDIAKIIQKTYGDDYPINVDEAKTEESRVVLSNKRFENEFGMRFFGSIERTVADTVRIMLAHKEEFLTDEERPKTLREKILEKAGWFVRASIPYLENIIFFILFFILNSLAFKSQYFSRLDLYLLYVLLFAVVHGQQQATFSAIFAVFGYFFGQRGERSILNIALDYNTYIWIAQLFIVGLVVGYMKDQIRKLRAESEEERLFLHRQLTDIRDINGSNVRVKDALETQIVNQNDSVGKIYSITSKLEKYTPEEVLFYAVEMVKNFLGTDDIAIYTVSNEYYARLFTFTSDKAKVLGKSIRYRELGEVYESLSEKRVYVNRTLDERYPMMAVGVYDRDELQTVIMAWGIPWERMTLGQADMLMVVSYLIQNAVLRASRYINMIENRRYQEGKLVMDVEPFTSLVKVFIDAREKHLTECVFLKLSIPDDIMKISGFAGVGASANSPDLSANDGRERIIVPDSKLLAVDSPRKARKSGFTLLIDYLNLPKLFKAKNAGGNTGKNKNLRAAVPLAVKSAAVMSGGGTVMDGYEAVAKGLSGKIRNTDYVGVLEDGNLYVLLCNTNTSEAGSAIERIRSGGYGCELMEDFRI